MNRRILTTLAAIVLTIASGMTASAKKIYNPPFKSRTSSVLTIEEMDLGKKETTVKFRAIFRPGYWFYLDDGSYLLDPATGEKFHPLPGQSILGKKVMMPESGDTTITVKYPPIPQGVKTLDFSPKSVFHTFGISLSDKNSKSSNGTPEEVLFSSTPRKPTPYFFKEGDVRIHGKMKGYDPRLGFDSFQLYLKDIPTGKSITKMISLDSCGNFDQTFFITSPQTGFIKMPLSTLLSLYVEPDNDINLLLDWEDMLDYDRMKGLKKDLEHVQFGGSLADMNRMIHYAPEMIGVRVSELAGSKTPEEAKKIISDAAAARRDKLNKYADDIDADPFMRKYLKELSQAEEAYNLLVYDNYRSMNQQDYPDSLFFKDPVPKEFYQSFLPDLLKADTTILATAF